MNQIENKAICGFICTRVKIGIQKSGINKRKQMVAGKFEQSCQQKRNNKSDGQWHKFADCFFERFFLQINNKDKEDNRNQVQNWMELNQKRETKEQTGNQFVFISLSQGKVSSPNS